MHIVTTNPIRRRTTGIRAYAAMIGLVELLCIGSVCTNNRNIDITVKIGKSSSQIMWVTSYSMLYCMLKLSAVL